MSDTSSRGRLIVEARAVERETADCVTSGLVTKSDKIRALATAGYLRTEIALYLGIRYQHVRQVLEQAGMRVGLREASHAALAPNDKLLISVTPAKHADLEVDVFPTERLLEAGFFRLGRWTATGAQTFELDCLAPAASGVYVFVVDGIIHYIGLTQRGIRTRMAQYVRGHVRQRTSARVKSLIIEALESGRTVEVLIATPEPMTWNGLPVLTAPGLEAGLIRLIRPRWNMQGLSR